MSDDWMPNLHPAKIAEIEEEAANYARMREIFATIAPELIDITLKLYPAGYVPVDHLAYELNKATYAEIERRGLGERADLMLWIGPRTGESAKSVETAVYRAFDSSDVLLYVGVTNSPRSRMRGHERTSEWWEEMQSVTFEWFDTREEALESEADLILTLRPPFNKAGNPDERAAL